MGESDKTLSDGGYSGQAYWDDYHDIASQKNLDRRAKLEKWLWSFLPLLKERGVKTALDLGCGSGNDALALAGEGFQVSGCDISQSAIDQACEWAREEGRQIDFRQHDIATALPYGDQSFDAVICNLTLHMFPPEVARAITAEVERCLVPGGLFAFHVNAVDDIPYRRRLQPPVIELDNGMYCFGRGQTMRFFSEADLRELLSGWKIVTLEPVQMLRADGAVQKCAWRCAAEKRL
jgi:SAM-dependent methyltransferase